jgi:hypothetical protein
MMRSEYYYYNSVGELPLEPFNLTDNIPHEIGTELKRYYSTTKDFIASVIDVSGGVGFVLFL